MANNELLKKIELLTEYEAAIEEMKAEAESAIEAFMEAAQEANLKHNSWYRYFLTLENLIFHGNFQRFYVCLFVF